MHDAIASNTQLTIRHRHTTKRALPIRGCDEGMLDSYQLLMIGDEYVCVDGWMNE
jgi:hypothetical protein